MRQRQKIQEMLRIKPLVKESGVKFKGFVRLFTPLLTKEGAGEVLCFRKSIPHSKPSLADVVT